MARGKAAEIGDTRVAQNGYHYTRAETGWRLTHHILAEEVLGRSLREDERVSFADGDRKNLSPDNIIVRRKGSTSSRRRVAQIDARVQELLAEKNSLLKGD